MTYTTWRRHHAHTTARALRLLYRTHGHLPAHRPDGDLWREWRYYAKGVAAREAAA